MGTKGSIPIVPSVPTEEEKRSEEERKFNLKKHLRSLEGFFSTSCGHYLIDEENNVITSFNPQTEQFETRHKYGSGYWVLVQASQSKVEAGFYHGYHTTDFNAWYQELVMENKLGDNTVITKFDETSDNFKTYIVDKENNIVSEKTSASEIDAHWYHNEVIGSPLLV